MTLMKKFKSPELQFENAFVRVWKTQVEPGESLEFDSSRVVVGLDSHKAYWNPHTVQEGEIMIVEMKGLIDSPLPSIPLE